MDDPDAFDEEWEDEANGNSSNPEINETSETKGSVSESPRLPTHDEDDAVEAMSSRLSSVRIEADPSAALSNEEARQTLLSRRNTRRASPPHANQIGQPVTERFENTTSSPSLNFQNYLRPITPSQPLIPDHISNASEEFLSDLSTSTPPGILIPVNDGPMTPTNNAGPFIFDGSAGRAAAGRAAIGLSQETQSAA